MVNALIKEVDLQKNFALDELKTIYFGGGTPSIFDARFNAAIIQKIKNVFDTSQVSEITLEANPEDITSEKVLAWKAAGVNRVSLGIQTLDDDVLKSLNRVHTGEQAITAIEVLKQSGIDNITIDLIYGLPDQQIEDWSKNLNEIISQEINHISAYALTVEDKTVLGHQQKQGLLNLPSDEQYEEQYMLMCKELQKAGYEHYEVSNFAKPGFRSEHNQLYWQGVPYLGIGPAAHSFDGDDRFYNISNNASYIRSIKQGVLPSESEVLTDDQQFNEYLLTRLRTNSGINLKKIETEYNRDLRAEFTEYLDECIRNQLAYYENNRFILTEKGFFVSDAIILELMN
jgi:oxygen-independent coproporphyrinogen-3 oxidase